MTGEQRPIRLARRSRRAIDRTAAPVVGALSGTNDAIRAQHLQRSLHEAIDHADDMAHAVVGRRPKRPSKIARRAHRATDSIVHGVAHADQAVQDFVAGTKEKVDAVAETAQRAVEAPPAVARDLRLALSSWIAGLAAGAGLMAASGFLALCFLVAFSVGAIVGLNILLGAPWGAFIVAAAYLGGAVACFLLARKKREEAHAKTARHLADARREVHNVTLPVRRAFSRKG